MSFSVGSGPIPHEESAAAPALVTPSTLRNRLRSIESVIDPSLVLVVAYGAVARHFVFDVAAHTPTHLQRGHLVYLRHVLHVAVACSARLRTERFDVAHVWEARETRQRVDAHPLRRLLLPPRIADLLDFGLVLRRGAADQLATPQARLQRWQSGLTGDGRRVVAVHARDLVLAGMDVVAKEDRLARTLERSGVVDDGRLVTRGSRFRLQCGRHCKGRGKNQPDHNPT